MVHYWCITCGKGTHVFAREKTYSDDTNDTRRGRRFHCAIECRFAQETTYHDANDTISAEDCVHRDNGRLPL